MAGFCHLKFYADIKRYHESLPCRQHPLTYSTIAGAERVANAELAEVRRNYGTAAGYIVLDEAGLEVSSAGGAQLGGRFSNSPTKVQGPPNELRNALAACRCGGRRPQNITMLVCLYGDPAN